jgi:hypothetical protein
MMKVVTWQVSCSELSDYICISEKMVDRRFSNIHSRHTNYSYTEERTEQFCSKVKQLKHITVRIGEEIKRQNDDIKV